MSPRIYRGRFAPSPTGPLHLGSLIAALASYLDARHHGGAWLLRMEDLDPPREEPGAARSILQSLQSHGLVADAPAMLQSTRHATYARALQRLAAAGHLFTCDCSRALLGSAGTCVRDCRHRDLPPGAGTAWRVAVPQDCVVEFADALQGQQRVALGETLGDFVLQRRDGLFAYQLAVVVDDCAQQITHVVRGSDLLDSTARQIVLQRLLEYPTPHYCHIPVITTRHGQKFSKQNRAPALDASTAADNLRLGLRFLGQREPPRALHRPPDILHFAAAHWSPAALPPARALPASRLGLDA